MSDVARFTVVPPLRCFYQLEDSLSDVCGALARWQRVCGDGAICAYFCDEHASPTDTPIAGAQLVRRVTVTLDVSFAGASLVPALARRDALARLEAAVRAAGGLINLHAVYDAVGRFEPPAPRRRHASRHGVA